MSHEQDPNEQANISGSDLAILIDEIKTLKADLEESDGVRGILAKHLAGVAIALKGPELALHRNGYHDLAEKAQVALLEIELLKHENQRLTGEAKVLRDLLIFARNVIEVVIADGDSDTEEQAEFITLVDEINAAMAPVPVVQLLNADDTEGGAW
jgi:hypothetical protein